MRILILAALSMTLLSACQKPPPKPPQPIASVSQVLA